MLISLKKRFTKPCILTITRSDGSMTWSKLHKGLETHDLAHFAVESTLNFSKAFYGIINDGYDINDFQLPRDQRPFAVRPENLHQEAIITEHIVNLLEIELLNSGYNDDFIEKLRDILIQNDLSFPQNLFPESLDKIRATYHNLYNQWLVLEDGDKLNIEFTP